MHDLSTPCCFVHHSSFINELNEFITKHGNNEASSEEAMSNFQRLLTIHFYMNLGPRFSAKHLGQAEGFGGYSVYWFHMVVPNCKLSRTQFPKAYLYKNENHISFLCLNSHLQNYKDSKLRNVANQRLQEIIEVLKNH